jgi:sugar phosphate permease
MIIWFGFAGSMFFGLLCTALVSIWHSSGERIVDLVGVIFPAGFLVFGYVMVIGGFKFESAKSKAFSESYLGVDFESAFHSASRRG